MARRLKGSNGIGVGRAWIVGVRFSCNWLQVLGTTKTPQIEQGVRHPLHPVVALLDVREPEEQPLACVLPRKGPLDALPSGMDGLVEQALAPALGGLAIPRMLLDGRNHPRMEDRLTMRRGIAPAVQGERRALATPTRQLGHPLQGLQP